VSHRPLVFVSGLTCGDYLLWSWSLGGNHDVLALVSGLTLPPLAVACVWLLALSVARLIARTARITGRPERRAKRQRKDARKRLPSTAATVPQAPAMAASTDTPPRKLAA
jgi:hypothetical protein